MRYYILARCEGTDGSFQTHKKWLKAHNFNYSTWEDGPYWSVVGTLVNFEEFKVTIEKWRNWEIKTLPGPNIVLPTTIIKPTIPPDISKAMKAHIDFIRDLRIDISSIDKRWMIRQVIKKYRTAIKQNIFCQNCRIRPCDEAELCNPCAGRSLLTWSRAEGNLSDYPASQEPVRRHRGTII